MDEVFFGEDPVFQGQGGIGQFVAIQLEGVLPDHGPGDAGGEGLGLLNRLAGWVPAAGVAWFFRGFFHGKFLSSFFLKVRRFGRVANRRSKNENDFWGWRRSCAWGEAPHSTGWVGVVAYDWQNMKKLGIGCAVLGVLAIIALVLIVIAGGSYNRLVRLSQGVDSQWAQVQNVYQRRADLIPNLVNTVAGAANFEKSTLVEVTQARASVGKVQVNPNSAPTDPAKLAEYQAAQGQLSSALSRLLVVAERYPELKANANFRDLQAQLEGTENRISVERGRFNEAVQAYNTAIKSFPTTLYSGLVGFKEKPYFTATQGAETPPQVQFNFGTSAPAPAPGPTPH